MHWCNSQEVAHTSVLPVSSGQGRQCSPMWRVTPLAKPGLGDSSLAPLEEHLPLQIVSEKPVGGRIRLCDYSHLFPGVSSSETFFPEEAGKCIWNTHGDFFFSLAIAGLSHEEELLWAAEQVGAVCKNLCPLLIVWCLRTGEFISLSTREA